MFWRICFSAACLSGVARVQTDSSHTGTNQISLSSDKLIGVMLKQHVHRSLGGTPRGNIPSHLQHSIT